jgi:tRNA pseudouridine38-40 synthase
VEYDGTQYHGFQAQGNQLTVQEELEKAILGLTQERVRVLGASRTDAGAHAKGQVVELYSGKRLPLDVWVRGLNRYLSHDVVVKAAAVLEQDFRLRSGAIARWYRYHLWNWSVPSPFWNRYAYQVGQSLDLERMQAVGKLLEGEHDFAPFCTDSGSLVVGRIHRVEVSREEKRVVLDIVGKSFLPHQVRSMAATLVWAGLGRVSAKSYDELAVLKQAGVAGGVLPARGLFLMQVDYGSREPRWEMG